VLRELISFEGSEIYGAEWPQLVGRTFDQACFAFSNAVVIGVFNQDAGRDPQVRVCPVPCTTLPHGTAQPGALRCCAVPAEPAW
jgi:hypothetical protein